jgi:hypothetical protein
MEARIIRSHTTARHFFTLLLKAKALILTELAISPRIAIAIA